jgi:DNA-binding NtrC family response regulator
MSVNATTGRVVLVVDADPTRASQIHKVAGELALTACIRADPAAAVDYRAACSVALIAIPGEPHGGMPELATIRALRSMAVPVIAYGDGIHAWEIRARCLPLIAGATHLLESAQGNFFAELKELLGAVVAAIAGRETEERELRTAMREVGIHAASKVMSDRFRLLARFSRLSDLPTLITGETGTGKEKFARALHQLDPKRSQGPFIPVNCGALSPTLAESELFGHRRGAFTGADRDRRGLVRAADGGILFLDEIGELPEAIQTKLLRVLQEGMVLTVGEERESEVDVRIVAATNRDLAQRVEQGSFRADLLHRLNVLQLHIPPLRERREDIRPLADYFIEMHCDPLALPCPYLADEAVEALERLKLPGNVRQLENIICRALVNRATPTVLGLRDLPMEVLSEVAEDTACVNSPAAVGSTLQDLEAEVRRQFQRLVDLTEGLDRSMDFCERILVSVALERARGNQSETARLLRITPRSVYNKLRRHQLQSVSQSER